MGSITPIFLTGFARSGTTWVNRLMRDYFDVGLVNEGQFIISFGSRIANYGDLHVVLNRKKLIKDLSGDLFFSILKKNYRIDIDWTAVENGTDSFSGIVKSILAQIAYRMGKHKIGSKYPVFGRYIDLLNSLFPDCLIIHVIRDGRDCALSHRSVTWGHQNTYAAAFHWRRYLEATRRSSNALAGRYLEIRYEDLLLQPKAAMGRLERFVTGKQDGPITNRFIQDHPVLRAGKVGRWRVAMPLRAQTVFESEAGDMLRAYDYPVTGVGRPLSVWSKVAYLAHDRVAREGWHIARKIFRRIPERR